MACVNRLEWDDMRRVLVLAPHTDDGELGCGASIAQFVEAGASVFLATSSIADESLPEGLSAGTLARELRASTAVTGIPQENVLVYVYDFALVDDIARANMLAMRGTSGHLQYRYLHRDLAQWTIDSLRTRGRPSCRAGIRAGARGRGAENIPKCRKGATRTGMETLGVAGRRIGPDTGVGRNVNSSGKVMVTQVPRSTVCHYSITTGALNMVHRLRAHFAGE